MSVQSSVHEFLATIAKGATNGDYVPMDPGVVADQVGTSRNKVNKSLFNLTTTGKIELERGANGRSIVGFKLLSGPQERQRRAVRKTKTRLSAPATLGPSTPIQKVRRTIHTPLLDEYAATKKRFGDMVQDFGELVDATFHENTYAEEGLALRERLDSIEGQWAQVHADLEQAQRDLRALRRLSERETREAIERSGQTVAHGD